MEMVYKSSPFPCIEVLLCTGGFAFQPHIHDRYVVWINTGQGEQYRVRGSSGILEKNQVCILEPGLVHSNQGCSPESRGLRSFYIDAGFFSGLGEEMGLTLAPGPFSQAVFRTRRFWKALAGLHQMMISSQAGLEMETRILEIFSGLMAEALGRVPDSRADAWDGRVKLIRDYFHDHPGETPDLEGLAQLAGCTRFHLIRLFKQHTSLSPHAYLIQVRLERARNLISKGALISDAALAAGFSDQSHLTRAFKIRYGITPKAYLKNLS